MGTLSKKHKELINGVGCCSVPMWQFGMPSGFCDKKAYSERPKGDKFYNYAAQKEMRRDGRYNGYVPALACPSHGGEPKEKVLNLCEFCKNHPATCKSNPKFGTGKGNDNIYECDNFKTKDNE